jgi:hypothetical protein
VRAIRALIAGAALALGAGCATSRSGSDADAGVAETDAATAADAGAAYLPGWHGQFCAAGARVVRAGGDEGIVCLGPVDTASRPANRDGMRWEPGPIYVISP